MISLTRVSPLGAKFSLTRVSPLDAKFDGEILKYGKVLANVKFL